MLSRIRISLKRHRGPGEASSDNSAHPQETLESAIVILYHSPQRRSLQVQPRYRTEILTCPTLPASRLSRPPLHRRHASPWPVQPRWPSSCSDAAHSPSPSLLPATTTPSTPPMPPRSAPRSTPSSRTT